VENTISLGPRGADPSDPRAVTILDLAEHWKTVRKRWRLVLTAVAVVCGAVFVWVYRQHRYYAGTCAIIIDPAAPKVLNNVEDVIELGGGGALYASRDFYETQFRIIASKEIAREVVDRLGLAADPDFPSPGLPPSGDAASRRENAINAVMDETKVTPVRESRIARIVVEDRVPERAAQIANALAAAYIDSNLQYKLQGSNSAAAVLGDQEVTYKDRLKKSELQLYDYRKENKLLDVNIDARQSMNTQNVQTYTAKLADLRTKKIELQSQLKLISAARDNLDDQESLPEVRSNTVIQQLRMMHYEHTKVLAELETTYGERHPKVEAVKRKLAAVDRDYVSEINKLLKSKENEFRVVEDNEHALMTLLDRERKEAIDLARLDVEYRPLAREHEENLNVYKLIAQRQKEAALTGAIRSNNVRVLDGAVAVRSPVRPRIVFSMSIALVVGLLLGVGAALSAEMLDNTVKNQEQAETILSVPVLGMIPMMGDKFGNKKLAPEEQRERDLGVFRDSGSTVAEACRSIRSNLLFISPERPLRSLVVTSPGPQEGKTTAAIALAITMAQAGGRVLLIDTDLRRPRIHRAFGLSNDRGVSSAIVGERTLDQAIMRTEIPNLDVLPCGPLPPNPAELLHTARFTELMQECLSKYERVIFDSPPTSAVTDPVIIGHLADGVVLVLRAGYTTRHAAGYARRQLLDAKARILGSIVNRVDPSDSEYNYYYARYYRSYRYGYGGTA
jgi:succinoglycan biosynthesis transport protein ExoP